MRGNGRIRGFVGGVALAALAGLHSHSETPGSAAAARAADPAAPGKPSLYIETYVTGYNTVAEQTDDAPCVAASGANICGRRDTLACPPILPLGAVVEIKGRTYVCEDRMARKYRTRFDINCDKDMRCPQEVTGWASVKVLQP